MLGQSFYRPPQQYPQHQKPTEGKRGAGIIGGSGQRESYRETVVPSLCVVAVGSARLRRTLSSTIPVRCLPSFQG
jgi:hypothetical protein